MTGTLLLAVLAPVFAWIGVFIIRPAASRARFAAEVSAVRDDCQDAVIAGHLPDTEAVRDFLAKAMSMVDNARFLGGMSVLYSVHAAVDNLGDAALYSAYSYRGLDREQNHHLAVLDERVIAALTNHAIDGSWLWWLYRPAYAIYRHWPVLKSRNAFSGLVNPLQMAREYNRVANGGRLASAERGCLTGA